MKTIVVPGEKIADSIKKGIGIYVKDGKTYSKYAGILYDGDFVRVIPLSGKYDPKPNDFIVGIIYAEDSYVYLLDINSYRSGILFKRHNKNRLYDVLALKVLSVNELKEPELESLYRLKGGYVIRINAHKALRVVGRNKSMQSLIEEKLNVKLTIGVNGLIYAVGGDPVEVEKVIRFIERYSHEDDLTSKVEALLDKKG